MQRFADVEELEEYMTRPSEELEADLSGVGEILVLGVGGKMGPTLARMAKRAGQFVWRPAGSRHEAWAGPKGGLFLAMFQIPNKFFKPDGRETDFLGNDWERTWGSKA